MVTTPNSLLKLVIKFVSQHLELVESLVGFPEIVGELIFRAAESSGRFNYHGDEYHECLRRLVLFTEAYGEVVLTKLSLTGRWSSFQLYKGHLQIFRDLTELELAGCGLEDADDLLPHIGQHLPKLKHLSLKQNKLTDKGLVRLTTPYRVMGVGPGKLALLNLSDNQEITGSGILKYLSAFLDLSEINITGTSIKRSEALLKIWKFDIKRGISTSPEVINTGWAADVVDKWAEQAEHSLVQAENEKSTTQRFYSSKRNKDAKSLRSKGTFKKTVSGYNIILSRIKEEVTISKNISADFLLTNKRITRISDPEQGTLHHLAESGHSSSELNNTDAMAGSDITTGLLYRNSAIHNSQMMIGYGINAIKSVNLTTLTSDQNLGDQCVITTEVTNSDLQVAKRRKINICMQKTKSNDNQKSECMDTKLDLHLSKDICKESINNGQEIKFPKQMTLAKTANNEMTKNDLEMMMGYLGSNNLTTGGHESQRSITHRIYGDEILDKKEAKLRFFEKGEKELMKACTKDSVRYMKRKKSMWNHINSSTS